MPIADIILALITVAENLISRAQQTGELTPEQSNALLVQAMQVFAKYGTPPPPPPGVTGATS